MRSSFLTTLLAVLGDQPEIENLPNDKLIALDYEGYRLDRNTAWPVFHKVARLQTLCFHSHKEAQMPDLVEIKQMASVMGGSILEIMANSLGTQEDATRRIMMLERLIVEIVRDVVPAEIEQFDVDYIAHIDGVIVRRPVQQRRFLD